MREEGDLSGLSLRCFSTRCPQTHTCSARHGKDLGATSHSSNQWYILCACAHKKHCVIFLLLGLQQLQSLTQLVLQSDHKQIYLEVRFTVTYKPSVASKSSP